MTVASQSKPKGRARPRAKLSPEKGNELAGLVLLAAGTALGLIGSFLVARFLEGMLFGVAPTDPATLGGVTLVMVAVGLAACAAPALQAARVDPLIAIRKGA